MSIFGLNSFLESARHVFGTDAQSGRAGTPWPAGQRSCPYLLQDGGRHGFILMTQIKCFPMFRLLVDRPP